MVVVLAKIMGSRQAKSTRIIIVTCSEKPLCQSERPWFDLDNDMDGSWDAEHEKISVNIIRKSGWQFLPQRPTHPKE